MRPGTDIELPHDPSVSPPLEPNRVVTGDVERPLSTGVATTNRAQISAPVFPAAVATASPRQVTLDPVTRAERIASVTTSLREDIGNTARLVEGYERATTEISRALMRPGVDRSALIARLDHSMSAMQAEYGRLAATAAELADLSTSDPVGYSEVVRAGLLHEVRAGMSTLRQRIDHAIEGSTRLHASERIGRETVAAETLRDNIAIDDGVAAHMRDPNVTDATLEADRGTLQQGIAAVDAQITVLRQDFSDAQAVVDRYSGQRLSPGHELELRRARLTLSGVGEASLQTRIEALSALRVHMQSLSSAIEQRRQILLDSVNGLLRMLGQPTVTGADDVRLVSALSAAVHAAGISDAALDAILVRAGVRAPGTSGSPLLLLNTMTGALSGRASSLSYGQLSAVFSGVMAAAHGPINHINAQARQMVERLGIAIPAAVTALPPAAQLPEVLAVLARGFGLQPPLDAGSLSYLLRVQTRQPVTADTSALHAAVLRYGEQSARLSGDDIRAVLRLVPAPSYNNVITVGTLRTAVANPRTDPQTRRAALTLLSTPDLLAQFVGTARGDGAVIFGHALFDFSNRADRIAAHDGASGFMVSAFYGRAEEDARNLQNALALGNLDGARTLLRGLSSQQRNAMLLEFPGGAGALPSLLAQDRFSAEDRGEILHFLRDPTVDDRVARLNASLQRSPDPRQLLGHQLEMQQGALSEYRSRLSISGARAATWYETDLGSKIELARQALTTFAQSPTTANREVLVRALAAADMAHARVESIIDQQTQTWEGRLTGLLNFTSLAAVTVIATVATLETAGVAGPTAAGYVASIGMGMSAGGLTAEMLNVVGQVLGPDSFSWEQVAAAANQGMHDSLVAAVSAGTMAPVMQGFSTLFAGTRIAPLLAAEEGFLARATQAVLAGGVNATTTFMAEGLALPSSADPAAAMHHLPESVARAFFSGLLMGPWAGRFHGATGRVLEGGYAGLEQMIVNRITHHPVMEGVSQAVVNGALLGGVFELHHNRVAARQLSGAHLQGELIHLPGERAGTARSWRVTGIDLERGTATVTQDGYRGSGEAPVRNIPAQALLAANRSTLARVEVPAPARPLLDRVLTNPSAQAALNERLNTLANEHAAAGPGDGTAYVEGVRRTITEAVMSQMADERTGAEAARARAASEGNAAIVANVTTPPRDVVEHIQALTHIEVLRRAEAIVQAEHGRRHPRARPLEGTALRDAVTVQLREHFAYAPGLAEALSSARFRVRPRAMSEPTLQAQPEPRRSSARPAPRPPRESRAFAPPRGSEETTRYDAARAAFGEPGARAFLELYRQAQRQRGEPGRAESTTIRLRALERLQAEAAAHPDLASVVSEILSGPHATETLYAADAVFSARDALPPAGQSRLTQGLVQTLLRAAAMERGEDGMATPLMNASEVRQAVGVLGQIPQDAATRFNALLAQATTPLQRVLLMKALAAREPQLLQEPNQRDPRTVETLRTRQRLTMQRIESFANRIRGLDDATLAVQTTLSATDLSLVNQAAYIGGAQQAYTMSCTAACVQVASAARDPIIAMEWRESQRRLINDQHLLMRAGLEEGSVLIRRDDSPDAADAQARQARHDDNFQLIANAVVIARQDPQHAAEADVVMSVRGRGGIVEGGIPLLAPSERQSLEHFFERLPAATREAIGTFDDFVSSIANTNRHGESARFGRTDGADLTPMLSTLGQQAGLVYERQSYDGAGTPETTRLFDAVNEHGPVLIVLTEQRGAQLSGAHQVLVEEAREFRLANGTYERRFRIFEPTTGSSPWVSEAQLTGGSHDALSAVRRRGAGVTTQVSEIAWPRRASASERPGAVVGGGDVRPGTLSSDGTNDGWRQTSERLLVGGAEVPVAQYVRDNPALFIGQSFGTLGYQVVGIENGQVVTRRGVSGPQRRIPVETFVADESNHEAIAAIAMRNGASPIRVEQIRVIAPPELAVTEPMTITVSGDNLIGIAGEPQSFALRVQRADRSYASVSVPSQHVLGATAREVLARQAANTPLTLEPPNGPAIAGWQLQGIQPPYLVFVGNGQELFVTPDHVLRHNPNLVQSMRLEVRVEPQASSTVMPAQAASRPAPRQATTLDVSAPMGTPISDPVSVPLQWGNLRSRLTEHGYELQLIIGHEDDELTRPITVPLPLQAIFGAIGPSLANRELRLSTGGGPPRGGYRLAGIAPPEVTLRGPGGGLTSVRLEQVLSSNPEILREEPIVVTVAPPTQTARLAPQPEARRTAAPVTVVERAPSHVAVAAPQIPALATRPREVRVDGRVVTVRRISYDARSETNTGTVSYEVSGVRHDMPFADFVGANAGTLTVERSGGPWRVVAVESVDGVPQVTLAEVGGTRQIHEPLARFMEQHLSSLRTQLVPARARPGET